MTDNTEALPPLPMPDTFVPYKDGFRGAYFDEKLNEYARAALAQRQQVPGLEEAFRAAWKQEVGSVSNTAGRDVAFRVMCAALAAQQGAQVQQGWKLVPVEPTPQMIEAGRWSEYGESSQRMRPVDDESVSSVWADMLSASPQAPAQPSEPAAPSAQAEPVMWANAALFEAFLKGSGRITCVDSQMPGYQVPLYAAPPPAQAEPVRQLHSFSSIDCEKLIAATVPGGSACDPQEVADSIRRYLNAWPSAQAEPQVPLTDEQIDSLRGLDTASRVRFYEHDFYVLSNFSAFNLRWKGNTFPTSEHAYHWEKFAGYWDATNAAGNIATQVLNAPSAHQAFKIAEGCKARRRPDWDDVKVGIMLDILREKAKQHEYVRRKLLATGDRELVEDSWRDDFWGWGPNRDGKNMLGKLWMQVRAELRGIGKQEGK